jgi:hypothetical protein
MANPQDNKRPARKDGPRDDRRKGGKGGKGRPADRAEEPRRPPVTARSVVDRGRGQVELPAVGEGGDPTRQDAAWSIAKVATHNGPGGKLLALAYELSWSAEGEAAEAVAALPKREFKTLAEAREAVGKKIVHPEKLTAPKGAAKGPSKGK